jgi:hypothetical protein
MLRELARSYPTVVKDLSRVMNRLKALYRSWAIPCAGRDVYYTRHPAEWLAPPESIAARNQYNLHFPNGNATGPDIRMAQDGKGTEWPDRGITSGYR